MSIPVADRVVEIVSDALDVARDRVHVHSSLIADLGAESIDFLDILFRVERAFDIKIPEDEMWKAAEPRSITIQTIVEYLERRGVGAEGRS
jgi:acyl carrier protein